MKPLKQRCDEWTAEIDAALAEQFLANLKMKIEHFAPEEIEAGIETYIEVGKLLLGGVDKKLSSNFNQ